MSAVEMVLHVGAKHGEGPVWDTPSERLWWVDIVGERVHEFDPTSGDDRSWAVAGQPGGVLVNTDGVPVVYAPDGLRQLDTVTGDAPLVVPVEANNASTRGNDITIDSQGTVWAGTMAYDKRAGAAHLYRIRSSQVDPVVDGLTISNGPAIDETDGVLYLADTALGTVDRLDIDVDQGVLSNRHRFLDVSAHGWWPDGMTVDVDGGLWVALGNAGEVHRYDRSGQRSHQIALPTTHPTSVAFGGADGADLYITTSWFDVPEADRPNEPLAGAMFVARPGVTGAGQPRWALPPDAFSPAGLPSRST
ncbi:MAG: SMP-30/gluconolactonase/LRE family protein [Actinomycetota bacterium]